MKLNLKDLQVKSFVTDMDSETSKTLKGGSTDHCSQGPWCTDFDCPSYMASNCVDCGF